MMSSCHWLLQEGLFLFFTNFNMTEYLTTGKQTKTFGIVDTENILREKPLKMLKCALFATAPVLHSNLC